MSKGEVKSRYSRQITVAAVQNNCNEELYSYPQASSLPPVLGLALNSPNSGAAVWSTKNSHTERHPHYTSEINFDLEFHILSRDLEENRFDPELAVMGTQDC